MLQHYGTYMHEDIVVIFKLKLSKKCERKREQKKELMPLVQSVANPNNTFDD